MSEQGAAGRGLGHRPPEHRARLLVFGVVMAVLVVGATIVSVVRTDEGDGSTTVALAPPSTTNTVASPVTSTAATTTESPSTTALPPTTPSTKGPASLSLAFAGDLLPHLPLDAQAARYGAERGQAYDFTPMLAPMIPVVSGADIAICHMEVPVAADQGRISGYPAFGAPQELVDAVDAAGYDGCSTASNHSLDQGRDGIAVTLDRFDRVKLKHAGTARSAQEGATITMYEVDGAKIAHLSYAYDFNGYKVPADAPFAANQIDVDRIRSDAERSRAAGAHLVVVSLHWGTEYEHEPSQYQRDVAAAILPSPDIDVIIGHHAHVVQPIEQVEGTYVVWGLGNQLANQPEVPRSDGLTAVLKADKQADGRYRVTGISAVPTWIEPGSYRVLPIVRTLQDSSTPAGLRAELQASYDRTAAVLASRTTPGLILIPRP